MIYEFGVVVILVKNLLKRLEIKENLQEKNFRAFLEFA